MRSTKKEKGKIVCSKNIYSFEKHGREILVCIKYWTAVFVWSGIGMGVSTNTRASKPKLFFIFSFLRDSSAQMRGKRRIGEYEKKMKQV